MKDIIFSSFRFLVDVYGFKYKKIQMQIDSVISYYYYKNELTFVISYDCREVHLNFRVFPNKIDEIQNDRFVILSNDDKFYGIDLNTILKSIDDSLVIKPFFSSENGVYQCTYGEDTCEYVKKYADVLNQYCNFLLDDSKKNLEKYIELELKKSVL